MRSVFTALCLLSLLALSLHAFAHSGEKNKDNGTMGMTDHDTMGMSSMDHSSMESGDSGAIDYGMEGETPVDDLDTLPSLGSSMDPLDLGTSPMPMGSSQGMNHSGQDMGKKHIEVAKHEWVITSSKGYGLAVGIAVLSGLAFGFLTLVRPLE